MSAVKFFCLRDLHSAVVGDCRLCGRTIVGCSDSKISRSVTGCDNVIGSKSRYDTDRHGGLIVNRRHTVAYRSRSCKYRDIRRYDRISNNKNQQNTQFDRRSTVDRHSRTRSRDICSNGTQRTLRSIFVARSYSQRIADRPTRSVHYQYITVPSKPCTGC